MNSSGFGVPVENRYFEDLGAFYLDEIDAVTDHELALLLTKRVAEIYGAIEEMEDALLVMRLELAGASTNGGRERIDAGDHALQVVLGRAVEQARLHVDHDDYVHAEVHFSRPMSSHSASMPR